MSEPNNEYSYEVSYDARSNFGKKGWWVIVYSGINWFIMGMLQVSLLNVLVPVYAGKLQVAEGSLLSMSTVAGLIGVVFAFFIGNLVPKFGVKAVNGLALLLTALSVFLLSLSQTFVAYSLTLIAMKCCVSVVQQVGGSMSIANWFPRKKGLAIGWSTIGVSLNSVCVVAAIFAMMGIFGDLKYALWVLAGFVLVFCICNFVFFKNYPEECGAYPDNDPNEIRKTDSEIHTGWTIGKALKYKETWIICFACGVMAMVTIGFMSTLVPNMMGRGYDQGTATMMISITSLFGAFGSYFLGWVDQKFGVKKSTQLFCILVLAGLIFYFVPSSGAIWGFLCIVGVTIGASSNYSVSVAAQMFGRDGSIKVFPVIYLLVEIISMLNFVILGQSLNMTGNYNAAWIVFGILMALSLVLLSICDFSPRRDPLVDKKEN